MKCTEKERETCNVEKQGCEGCYYSVGIDFGEGESKTAISRKIEMSETEKKIRELQQYEYNNDKIKVGEYVRTKSGHIFKLDKEQLVLQGINFLKVQYGKIVKHSKNIIDLIECDDIVILEYYVRKYGKRISRRFEVQCLNNKVIYFDNRHCSFCYDLEERKWRDGKGNNPKIKAIVTKEQFASVEYKI